MKRAPRVFAITSQGGPGPGDALPASVAHELYAMFLAWLDCSHEATALPAAGGTEISAGSVATWFEQSTQEA